MSDIATVLNRRFGELSSQNNKGQAQRAAAIAHLKSAPSGGEMDSSITWYPASDFLKLENTNEYSFRVPHFPVDPILTDGKDFKAIVQSLTSQLESHIEKANFLVADDEKPIKLSDSVEESIRVAIGRTHLLLSKRMKQFKEQLERHLNPIDGQKVTKLNDLHGLWALIEMQLEDIRACFEGVEKCRLNNWSSDSDEGGTGK